MIVFIVRFYDPGDLEQLIKVYQSAFAEPPWNEFKKCSKCGASYGIFEINLDLKYCKKCNEKLELVEFWSSEDIKQDLEFALSQKNPIVLVAENSEGLEGFCWGYQMPFEKFPFLIGKCDMDSNYMDEIAVKSNKRRKGIGLSLCKEYLFRTDSNEIVLRTDNRNSASMSLFRKAGFLSLNIYDPQYSYRVYLSLKFGDKK